MFVSAFLLESAKNKKESRLLALSRISMLNVCVCTCLLSLTYRCVARTFQPEATLARVHLMLTLNNPHINYPNYSVTMAMTTEVASVVEPTLSSFVPLGCCCWVSAEDGGGCGDVADDDGDGVHEDGGEDESLRFRC